MTDELMFLTEVKTRRTAMPYRVDECIGGGGQGEVYRVTGKGHNAAVKCFYDVYVEHDAYLLERLSRLISTGAPDQRFVWPLDLVTFNRGSGTGYLMPLLPPGYKPLSSIIDRREQLSLKTSAELCFQLADSLMRLHTSGLCHKDLSFKNVFFHPETHRVAIIDNDNVDIDDGSAGGVLGTLRFLPPELVEGKSFPCSTTDLFAMAVIFLHLLVKRGPLERDGGEKKDYLRYFPGVLRDLFNRTFREGLERPSNRPRAGEWRRGMVLLRDSIVNCGLCGNENCFDFNKKIICGTGDNRCRVCGGAIKRPLVLRIGSHRLVLNRSTRLYPHYLSPRGLYDFSSALGEVKESEGEGKGKRLKNLSTFQWIAQKAGGLREVVRPGRSFVLEAGMRIFFGSIIGEVLRLGG